MDDLFAFKVVSSGPHSETSCPCVVAVPTRCACEAAVLAKAIIAARRNALSKDEITVDSIEYIGPYFAEPAK